MARVVGFFNLFLIVLARDLYQISVSRVGIRGGWLFSSLAATIPYDCARRLPTAWELGLRVVMYVPAHIPI